MVNSSMTQAIRGSAKDVAKKRIKTITSSPAFASAVQHAAAIFPHRPDEDTYTLPAFPSAGTDADPATGLPVPPRELWASYGADVETYLRSGQEDVATIRRLLEESGAPVEGLGRLLEFGVAGGRLIRNFADLADAQEIWGVDVWATAILWCHEHLSPPFHFATTTVTPHLPFEDRSFGLVIAGSVWTHLDDLAEAWALEMHRILAPGGRLFFTINDRSAVRIFEGEGERADRERYIERVRPEGWTGWLERLAGSENYQLFAGGRADMVTMGRNGQSHVLWDADYLIKRLGPGWRVCSVTPAAYGHQTGVLLERV